MSFFVPAGAPCRAAYDIVNDGFINPPDYTAFLDYLGQPVACAPAPPPSAASGCATYTGCDVVCGSVCNVPEMPVGTASLPPEGCTYLSPNNFHKIVDSLPPGTELQVNVAHRNFTNIVRTPEVGPPLPGEFEAFDSEIRLQIHGTGALASYQRVVILAAPVEIYTAHREPGPVQQFDTRMLSLVAEITPADGDPDFDTLKITAGSNHGMHSPGRTTLTGSTTPAKTNSFDVDSSFEVNYEVEMVGAAGGPLETYSSITTGTLSVGTPPPAVPGVPAMGAVGIAAIAALLAGLGFFSWRRRAAA